MSLFVTIPDGDVIRDPQMHHYVVAHKGDGKWGVYCFACSVAEDDYVMPCRIKINEPAVPPILLVDADV